jgi:RNA polymerase sigma factor (sigma-70 family)
MTPAQTAYVNRHISIVHGEAHRHAGRLPVDELEGYGFLGLCRAAKSYRPQPHHRFITGTDPAETWARVKIRGEIIDGIRSWCGCVYEQGRRAGLRQPHEELPEETYTPEDEWIANLDLDRTLRLLSTRQRQAVYMRHVLDMRLADIGAALGVSEAAACKLCGRAYDRLRGAES